MKKNYILIVFFFILCASLLPGRVFAATQTWQLRNTPLTEDPAGGVNCWDADVWAATAPNGLGGSGLFVTVSCDGHVLTSPDGSTWTPQTGVPFNQWNAVTWSPELGLFVAVGLGGTDILVTSPDGVNWTGRHAVIGHWLNVTWAATAPNGLGGNGLFVAVGYPSLGAAQVMTSPDGVTWTARTAAASQDWNSVIWSPSLNLFVAVSQSGTNEVMTSPDGITWTLRADSSSIDNTLWNAVTWSPDLSLFVAVDAGTVGAPMIMTSPDGITWTSRTAIANDWYNVVWSHELNLFVVVGFSQGSGQEILTSPDGITWTPRTNAGDANFVTNYTGIAWSPELGIFAAFSYSNNIYMTSTDGTSFTSHATPLTPHTADSGQWVSLTWAEELGLFVAVSQNATNNKVMTSSDGITWTPHLTGVNNSWNSLAWSPDLGLFAAVSFSGTGNRIMTSPDGITWTARSSVADNVWKSITWSHELGNFVAVAANGTLGTRVMTSPDGINWTAHSASVANPWTSVVWSPQLGIFVAVASGGTGDRVMTSPDGITWTTRVSAADSFWQSVTWSPELGLFVAVSQNGANQVMTSPDGITWTARNASTALQWQYVIWSKEAATFVAVGFLGSYVNPTIGNFVMTSPDGITWTSHLDALNNNYSSVAWSPSLDRFVAVASGSNTSLSSPNIGDLAMTTLPDGPVISAVSATPSSTGAVITWTTDISADSTVQYGTTTGYGSSTTNATLTLSHSVTLSGLTCATLYDYRVVSVSGGTTYSSNHTFTTTSCSAPAPAPSSPAVARHGIPVTVVQPQGPADRPLGFTVLGQSGKVATLRLDVDPLTVKGFVIGLFPSLDDSSGIIQYSPGVNFILPDTGAHKIYLKYYSTSGVFSPVFARSTVRTGATNASVFIRQLKIGSTGEDVRTLQSFLNAHGFAVATAGNPGSQGRETAYYGTATARAVSRFQEAHTPGILTPNGLNAGTGIFGPATIKFVNTGAF